MPRAKNVAVVPLETIWEVPDALCSVVHRLLAKPPEQRQQAEATLQAVAAAGDAGAGDEDRGAGDRPVCGTFP